MRYQPNPINQIILTSLLTLSVFALSGCKSGAFKRPDFSSIKAPDMSGLAFWKNKNQRELPPPPAHQFDPVSSSSQQIAGASTADSDIQAKFNALASAAKTYRESEQPIGLNQPVGFSAPKGSMNDLASSQDKPIRSPYSTDKIEAPKQLADNNGFDFNSAPPKIELPDFNASTKKAQQDFAAALAGTNDAIKNSVAPASKSAQEIAQSLNNDSQFANTIAEAKQKASQSQNEFNQSMANVNRGLYDSAGNLTAKAKDKTNAALGGLQPNLGSVASNARNTFDSGSFGNRSAGKAVAATASTAQQSVTQFGQQVAGNTIDQFQTASTQIQNTTSQIKDAGADSISQIQSEMALARQQIAELKQQVATAKQTAVSNVGNASQQAVNFASQATAKPVEHIAKLNIPQFGNGPNSFSNQPATNQNQSTASIQTSTENFSPLDRLQPQNSTAPNNVLRNSSQFQNESGQPNSQSQPGQYPSTPHNGYTHNAPTGGDGTTQFANQFAANGSTVIQADAASAERSGFQSAVSSATHVSEVDIPAAVLQGSSSYAPGSVNRLKPGQ